MDEVVEVIELPDKLTSCSLNGTHLIDPNSVDIEPSIVQLVHEYVTALAERYNDCPFHCFEHAGHVTMSASKLMLARPLKKSP